MQGVGGPIVEKRALKCPLGWQNTLSCPLGWLKHDKLPSWESQRMLKCPLQWPERAAYILFSFFLPLPFKKSVHPTVLDCVLSDTSHLKIETWLRYPLHPCISHCNHCSPINGKVMDHAQRDSWQFLTNFQQLFKLYFKLKCCISHLQILLCCQQPFTISLNLWSRIESILISDSRNAVGIAESRRWRELAEEEQRRQVSSQEERFGHAMVSNSDFDDNRKWFGGVFL